MNYYRVIKYAVFNDLHTYSIKNHAFQACSGNTQKAKSIIPSLSMYYCYLFNIFKLHQRILGNTTVQ